jgi:hypothetical protein
MPIPGHCQERSFIIGAPPAVAVGEGLRIEAGWPLLGDRATARRSRRHLRDRSRAQSKCNFKSVCRGHCQYQIPRSSRGIQAPALQREYGSQRAIAMLYLQCGREKTGQCHQKLLNTGARQPQCGHTCACFSKVQADMTAIGRNLACRQRRNLEIFLHVIVVYLDSKLSRLT